MYTRSAFYLQIILVFFLFSPFVSYALNVVPFSGELDLNKQSSYKFHVSNPKQRESAVKISVQQWEFDENGVETRKPSNDLIVFPKRMLLEPKGERSVRVSFRPKNVPLQEKAYRIIVEEVPIRDKQRLRHSKGSLITVLTRYVTAFYVKPHNALSNIKVLESNLLDNGFSLRIRNEGNAHTHFIQPSLTIHQADKKLIINELDLLDSFASTNIFALGLRSYHWEIPENFRDTLDFSQPYKVLLDWTCENCTSQKDQISFIVD